MILRHAARTDANQAEIAKALRDAGCSVVSLHRVGMGVPDLLVGRHGRTYLLEVKAANGVLATAQKHWHYHWSGDDVRVVRTPEEALAAVGLKMP
jgi:hypothetical protein